ncbi:hypothetical protein Emed_005883 [Eimeria media]
MPIVDAKVLKKLSTFAGGGSHGRRSSSYDGEQHRRSLDEGRLGSPSSNAENGTQNAEAEDLRNAIEMLIVENKHLKTLIEERDARQKSTEAMDRGALVDDEEVQQLRNKVASLEAQLKFECESHAEELQEKEARVAELEMQLLDAQRKSPSIPTDSQESPQGLREKEELQRKIEALTAELNQKEDELQKTRNLLSSREGEDRPSEGGRTQAENAESQQRERELQQRIEALQLKLSAAEQQRADAEEALRVQSKLAGGPEEAEKVIEELRKEIRDKDEALSGMSKQLLEVSAEKDELAQELQNQKDIVSAPETPRAPSSRRSFFSRSKSSAQEREALASQVQQLEEQMQKMTEKRVDLERTKVKLEGQLAEATQELRAARSEKAAVEEKLSEREATLEALRSAHADMQKPLEAPENLILPLPKGPQETDYDVRAASVLKDGIIRTLSSRIAHLQFALGEVTAEKQKLITQPASVALGQQLEETKKELAETLTKYRDAVNQRTELKEKVQDLTAEVKDAHRETETLRAALDEAQQRLTTTADKYKEQSDRYRGIVSSSLVKVEELQDEVLRERNGKLLVGKLYRQEMLELRQAAVLAGGVRGDPLRPLSLNASQTEKEQQQQISPSQQAASAAASTEAPHKANHESFSSRTTSPFVTKDGHCPFSRGLPAALTGDAAVVSVCCPLEPIHRPRETDERGALLGTPSRTSLTDDQRLAAEILHASVREREQAKQTRSSPCMHEDEAPFRSASPSRSVDVEPPFTPQAMQDLQQQQQLRSAQSAQGRQQQDEQQQQPGHSQQKQQQQSQAGQAPSEPSYIATARQQQEQQQQQLDEGASAFNAAGRRTTERASDSTSIGTRVLVPQPNNTDQPFPSSSPEDDFPAAAKKVTERAGSMEASDGLRTHMGSGAAYDPTAVEDVLRYASPPPPRIDESTVMRDLHALQNKKRVLFSRGSASLSEAERSGSVDLS